MKRIIVLLTLFILSSACFANGTVTLSNNTQSRITYHFSFCSKEATTIKCENSYLVRIEPMSKNTHTVPDDEINSEGKVTNHYLFEVLDAIETEHEKTGIQPFLSTCRADPSQGTNSINLESHAGAITCKVSKVAWPTSPVPPPVP